MKEYIVISAITNCGGVLTIRKESDIVTKPQAINIFERKKNEFKSIANEQNEQANRDIYAVETDTTTEFTIYDYGSDIMSVKIIEISI